MPYIGKPQSSDPITVNNSNIEDGTIIAADISSSLGNVISGSLGSNASVIRTLDRTTLSGSFNETSSSFSTRTTTLESASGSDSTRITTIEGRVNQGVKTTDSPTFAGGTVTGDFTVGGTLTAQEVHTEFESASILFTSGSTKFGDSGDDIHNMTGSIRVSGSAANESFILGHNLGIGTTNPVDLLHVGAGADSPAVDSVAIFTHPGTTNVAIRDATQDVELLNYAYSGGGLIGTVTNHTFGIRTNNTNRITILNDGKVGISTTTPQSLLQVATSNGTTSHFGGIGTTNTHYSGISLGYTESGNANYRKTMIVQEQIGDGAARGHLHFLVDIANDGNSAVLGDSKMTIHGTNGHVGIGTTTPSTATNVLLSVGSTGLGYAGMEFIAGTNAERWRLYSSYNDDTEAVWGLYRVADATYKFLVHENGAMGIGTASPSGNLQVEGSNGAQLKLSSAKTSIGGTDPLGVIEFVGNDSSSGRSGTMARIYAFINRPTDSHTTNIDGSANEGTSLSFQTGIDTSGSTSMTVSEKMRLDKAGNLGIGAVSFGPRLYAIVDNDEYAAYFTSDSNSGSNAAVAIRADSSSGDRKLVAFWNGGGNVANITYNGSTATYGTGSDRRLKTNIIDFKDGLSILNKVEVKKFDWITGRKQDVGIVAQDLYNTIPKVIVKGDDNETDIEQPWQVDYPRLVPYLINAVQELSSEITDLKKEVKELKS